MHKVISFYRYCAIEHPQNIKNQLRNECESRSILGRILIAKEGINGAICGLSDEIETLKKCLDHLFPYLTYREQLVEKQAYHKLVMKVRDEIVRFAADVDLRNSAPYITPAQLNQLYEQKADVVIVDARNEYEYDVGHFKNAVKMPIGNFREFSSKATVLDPFKQKKVVLYCTGGIRCEKATAYLKEQGFKDVAHLQGGIINYLNQEHRYWKGGLFVFDDRLVADGENIISACALCHAPSARYINCYNLDCDRLFIVCSKCELNMKSTCSEDCKNAPRQRQTVHQHTVLGRVENYFRKNKVAVVNIEREIVVGQDISFVGKTTAEFKQEIRELRRDEENMISFPVKQKVRKGDMVVQCR